MNFALGMEVDDSYHSLPRNLHGRKRNRSPSPSPTISRTLKRPFVLPETVFNRRASAELSVRTESLHLASPLPVASELLPEPDEQEQNEFDDQMEEDELMMPNPSTLPTSHFLRRSNPHLYPEPGSPRLRILHSPSMTPLPQFNHLELPPFCHSSSASFSHPQPSTSQEPVAITAYHHYVEHSLPSIALLTDEDVTIVRPVTSPKSPKVQQRYSMGFRSDCAKCRARVQGHYSHVGLSPTPNGHGNSISTPSKSAMQVNGEA